MTDPKAQADAIDPRASLISRLEAATGPDRALDAEIAKLVGAKHGPLDEMVGAWPLRRSDEQAPAYTGSLDAAMTLVPEGWNRRLSETDSHRWWVELREGFETSYNRVALASNASTPAIGFCIAALKARGIGSGE